MEEIPTPILVQDGVLLHLLLPLPVDGHQPPVGTQTTIGHKPMERLINPSLRLAVHGLRPSVVDQTLNNQAKSRPILVLKDPQPPDMPSPIPRMAGVMKKQP